MFSQLLFVIFFAETLGVRGRCAHGYMRSPSTGGCYRKTEAGTQVRRTIWSRIRTYVQYMYPVYQYWCSLISIIAETRKNILKSI